jgi:hypothetical protein
MAYPIHFSNEHETRGQKQVLGVHVIEQNMLQFHQGLGVVAASPGFMLGWSQVLRVVAFAGCVLTLFFGLAGSLGSYYDPLRVGFFGWFSVLCASRGIMCGCCTDFIVQA